ncbi:MULTISPECIES: hypothetical protein [Delftia]|nr:MULTISPECIES: hypothetical protein [Delftia]MDC2857771.1 hypothetical protein [Delftia sp. DT-2]MDH0771972.1 hypothetical protein [Delftia tsuruhatensis]MDH1456508.1 hypothetical protein [Delftia tsuruhatensis]MDH1822527.1 hypothetical protein [Delftia tsuruhatensis]WGG10566.1 hypothetical protein N5O86_28610 [Delftia tsuruhatensis]
MPSSMTRPRLAALAILVIALLFQWTWMAAAALCRHDGHETRHFGHHVHGVSLHGMGAERHAGTGTDAESGPPAQKADQGLQSSLSVDCSMCHAWVAAATQHWQAAPAAPPPAQFAEPLRRHASAVLLRPDRPRWQG